MKKTKKSLLVLVCALCVIVAASLAFNIIEENRQNTTIAFAGNDTVIAQSQNSDVDVYYLDGSLWIYNLAGAFPFICIPVESGMYNLEAFRRGGGYMAFNIYDSTGLVYSFDENNYDEYGIITESIRLNAFEKYYIELAEYAIDDGAYI